MIGHFASVSFWTWPGRVFEGGVGEGVLVDSLAGFETICFEPSGNQLTAKTSNTYLQLHVVCHHMAIGTEGESEHSEPAEDGTVDDLQWSDNELVEREDRFGWVGAKLRSVVGRRES